MSSTVSHKFLWTTSPWSWILGVVIQPQPGLRRGRGWGVYFWATTYSKRCSFPTRPLIFISNVPIPDKKALTKSGCFAKFLLHFQPFEGLKFKIHPSQPMNAYMHSVVPAQLRHQIIHDLPGRLTLGTQGQTRTLMWALLHPSHTQQQCWRIVAALQKVGWRLTHLQSCTSHIQ